MRRWEFIDTLRGLAIVLMVFNHAGHYLAALPHSIWSYSIIYLTVTLAGPLFLFIAGFSAALSIQKYSEISGRDLFSKFLKRGLMLIGLGLLVNLFFYYDEPIWRGRILMTIGLSSILIYPFYYWAAGRFNRLILMAAALSGFFLFPLAYPFLAVAAGHQPVLAEIFWSEFPIYPWFFLMLLGLLAGREFLARAKLTKKSRQLIFGAGASLIFAWLALTLIYHGGSLFSFLNDYNLNGYWNPSPLTWLWILGWIMLLFLFFYAWEDNLLRSNVRSTPSHSTGQVLRSNWLAVMGRKALWLYFLQFFLIITLGRTLLRLRITDLTVFILINLIIIYLLCLSAKYKRSAIDMACGRLKPKARIS